MSVLDRSASRPQRPAASLHGTPAPVRLGPIGRLGRFMAGHFRGVVAVWVLLAVGLGIFAPRAETGLAGAGWQASGSQSVRARTIIDRDFHGMSAYDLEVVVHSASLTDRDPAFTRAVRATERELGDSRAVSTVVAPTAGQTISRDGHTAVVQAGAAKGPNAMVAAATTLAPRLAQLTHGGVSVGMTGDSALWAQFNTANRSAMLRSELISWPVTLGILLLAFGSLVAAGLPLMLTMVGLLCAAGLLFLGTQVTPISIWAMNFALMFALALGIDYALFVVSRYRASLLGEGRSPVDAVGVTMDTAGKAVLFSGVTVLISLSAVMLVPSPAFRSMSLGIMLAVVFVLAATLTLLPAVLGRIGPKVDRLALPWAHAGEHRSTRFAAWGQRLARTPVRYGLGALIVLVGLAIPVTQLHTGMPSIKVIPASDSARVGYRQVSAAFGPGATGPLQIVVPARQAAAARQIVHADPGIAGLKPTQVSHGEALITAIPTTGPSTTQTGATIDHLRRVLPRGALVGGAAAEDHDLKTLLVAKTPLVIGVVLGLGFLLLLIALQAPLIAAVGVLSNLLAAGAAFGVAKWVFQDGALHSLLGFQPQGFLDAWAPVFFFAMIFAISMDYTVFLLSSAKEHWERTHNAETAMVEALASSGRVIFAAAGVMVAVFFTFALSGPLPPKEMGIVLGVAVLLDAALIRLLLLPVMLKLMGARGWYLPRPLRRVLPHVSFGHTAPAAHSDSSR